MDKTDLEKVLNNAIDLAKRELEKNGVLAPFSCSLNDGRLELQMAAIEGANVPTKETVKTLKNGLRELSKDSKNTVLVLCADVRMTEPKEQDAIALQIEGRDGTSLIAHLPYSKSIQGEIIYGEMQFAKGNAEFFVT